MGARRQEGAWLIIMPSIPSFASILRISTKSQRHTLVFLAMNSLDYLNFADACMGGVNYRIMH